MAKQVRINIFETNSSSVNTISLFRKSDWEDFKAGKLILKIEPDPNKDDPKIYLVDIEESEKNSSENSRYYDYERLTKQFCVIKELDNVIGILLEEYNW